MHALFQLRPMQALHDYWRSSSAEAHLAVGGPGIFGWAARVDWAAVLSVAALAAMTIGGCAIQLLKQYRLMQLEIEDRKRKLDACGAAQPAPQPPQ
jgi:hypothetical protein